MAANVAAMSELAELKAIQDVNIWGRTQQTLEEEALEELQIFSEENQSCQDPKDVKAKIKEAQVEDATNSPTVNAPKPRKSGSSFNIQEYFKNQACLQKKQVYNRTLVPERKVLKLKHKSPVKVKRRNKRKNDEIKCTVKEKRCKRDEDVVEKGVEEGGVGEDGVEGDGVEGDGVEGDGVEGVGVEGGGVEEGGVEEGGVEEDCVEEDGVGKEAACSIELNKNLESNEKHDINKETQKNRKRKRVRTVPVEDDSGSEYVPSEGETDEECEYETACSEPAVKPRVSKSSIKTKALDDGCYDQFNSRLEEYYRSIEKVERTTSTCEEEEDDAEYIKINGGLKVPGNNWNNLYSYQKDGIKWLWNIHQNTGGGLLGDEMGLGKTVQIIVFLQALSYTQVKSKFGMYNGLGPTLIVAPATVLHQWVEHFHDWAPEFRVAVLHSSGSYKGDKLDLVKEINKSKDILITTYSSILKYREVLLDLNWHYLILDEGHKIRNPAAKVTVALKRIRTLHRLMLTGSPMQNNLQELWCIFDFINPGMLGTLPVFMEHFADPIVKGGYMNATPIQEATALTMANILKSKVTKCMLRRTKDVVQKYINLPNKTEQVLFCTLTEEQRNLYKSFLLSDDVQMCLGRTNRHLSQNQIRANVLVSIMHLRKICNHPDLYTSAFEMDDTTEAYLTLAHNTSINSAEEEEINSSKDNNYKKSGKMIVVSALLKIWKKQKHRSLLFTQARGMIRIFQNFLEREGYKYLKMDGTTSVSSRQNLIATFNSDESIDVFLLTTKVGGLGLNLVGADRVVIYDPDWNPATDTQARERAWRIGQDKEVTIYRLISAGTIEEKIYRRQIFKQLLANKVLVDPTAQKFFRTSDLFDIFSLQEQADESNIESANIFRNTRIAIQKKIDEKKSRKRRKHLEVAKDREDCVQRLGDEKELESRDNLELESRDNLQSESRDNLESKDKTESQPYQLSEEKIRQMRELAKKIARSVGTNLTSNSSEGIASSFPKCDTNRMESRTNNFSEKGNFPLPTLIGRNIVENPVPSFSKRKKHKKRPKERSEPEIDGEKVDGLMKIETSKTRRKENEKQKNGQDEYILEKLFSSGGVQIALQHDSVFKTASGERKGIAVQYEASLKADLALQALENSVWR